ncbi:hypothetical protein EWM64_g6718 [Hericium alpestre]|uniref:DUF7719 domain-containing protein n=1 Tax=Hericium alpestre TaxID=135208 RepID=A0A4Y9ZSQ2_9AGAM|nr:hypothetical protein EWM64_g6718 [Hericium alpestre]
MARSRKTRAKPAAQPDKPLIDIPEEEQWRLIQQTGILNTVTAERQPAEAKADGTGEDEDEDEVYPLAEEIFSAVTLIIPISFLLLLMYILVHFQYRQQPDWSLIAGRMASSIPILSVFVFYTNRHKARRRAQFLLFLLAIAAGMRMIWMVNWGNWLKNMQQLPPLGTIWVFAIIELDLGPAVLSLALVVTLHGLDVDNG